MPVQTQDIAIPLHASIFSKIVKNIGTGLDRRCYIKLYAERCETMLKRRRFVKVCKLESMKAHLLKSAGGLSKE